MDKLKTVSPENGRGCLQEAIVKESFQTQDFHFALKFCYI